MIEKEILELKQAVIYCRVSTKEQVEEGNSLVTQEKLCREYAMRNGYSVSEIFIEQGESAKSVDRTQLQKLLKFCANKKTGIKAVIAYKIDRISRNTDDYSQIRIILKKHGVEIKSTSEHFEDSPSGRFMENIIANVAQFDNDVRAERCVNGMKEACREGRYVWMAPVGYRNVKIKGKATIEADEKVVLVQEAFQRILNGQESLEVIRRSLNSKGLMTRYGKPIVRSAFDFMIRNPVYKGEVLKFGESHKGNFPAIVPPELFDMVQLKLKGGTKRKSYIYDNPDFPLRRFVSDHETGFLLSGGWSTSHSGKRYPYYRSSKAKVNYSKKLLEDQFESFLNRFSLDEKHIEELNIYINKTLGFESLNKESQAENLQKRMDQLVLKQGLILDDRASGYISGEVLKKQMDVIEMELIQLRYDLSQVSCRNIDVKKFWMTISEFLKNPYKAWSNLDLKGKCSLQWFEFPQGLSFDGKKFRTPKTCFIFRLKEIITPLISFQVHSKDSRLNQAQITNLKEDLEKLNNILNGHHPEDEDDLLTYHSRFPS